MKTIRFIRDTDEKQQGGAFKKGATVTLSEPSAMHWITRGMAEDVARIVKAVPPKLVLDRPMMSRAFKPDEVAKPKKAKRKKDPGVVEMKTGPSLPVKGSGKNGGPGWDDD